MYLAPLNYDRFFKKVFSDLEIAKRFLEDFLDISIEEITLLPTKAKITDSAMAVEFDFRCRIKGQYVVVDMLIWMANDNLNFNGDYVAFTMLPEALANFVRLERLWEDENRAELLALRQELLLLVNNNTRQLDFLSQNRLIYAFQDNIVGNNDERLRKYYAWFEFAEKTRNKDNKPEDFQQYKKDPIFVKIMERIAVEDLPKEDLDYVEQYEQWTEEFLRYDIGIRKEAKQEGQKEEQLRTAERCLRRGMSLQETAEISGLPIETIKTLAKQLGITS